MKYRWALLALFWVTNAFAMGGGVRVAISGTVSDFDDRYLFIDARSERYRVKRESVPENTDLRPGAFIDLEVSLKELRVLPATRASNVALQGPSSSDTRRAVTRLLILLEKLSKRLTLELLQKTQSGREVRRLGASA